MKKTISLILAAILLMGVCGAAAQQDCHKYK